MRIRVRTTPGARRESLKEGKPNVFDVSVREEAQGNAANQRVRELVAKHFRVALASVRIVTGQRSRNKTISVSS